MCLLFLSWKWNRLYHHEVSPLKKHTQKQKKQKNKSIQCRGNKMKKKQNNIWSMNSERWIETFIECGGDSDTDGTKDAPADIILNLPKPILHLTLHPKFANRYRVSRCRRMRRSSILIVSSLTNSLRYASLCFSCFVNCIFYTALNSWINLLFG